VGRNVKGTAPLPRFSETPAKIWRGTTAPGADNAAIYGDLLGRTDLDQLREKGVV
jgi:crotonobetainyl-CoA:carnitine CoA-transferase CaiB-like acyl-CoA transferase